MPEYLRFSQLRPVGIPFARETVLAMCDRGDFPRPVAYGKQRAWLKNEIEAWVSRNLAARGA